VTPVDPLTIDWPPRPPRSPPRRRRLLLALLIVAGVLFFGGDLILSYYVDALWFASLGYSDVFWTSIAIETAVFAGFAVATFLILYGAYLLLKPARMTDLGAVIINGRPVSLPVEPVLRVAALVLSLFAAVIAGAGMMAEWPTFALWWHAAPALAGGGIDVDPIFGRPLAFYLFTLPAWEIVAGWLTTMAVIVCGLAVFFAFVSGGAQRFTGSFRNRAAPGGRGLAITWALLLLVLAVRTWLGRFERLFDDHTIFAGVTYTDAHVSLTGMLIVAGALAAGAVVALVSAARGAHLRWLVASILPAAVCYVGTGAIASYVESFVVKPNELVREKPFIASNIALTRQAYGLDRVAAHPFPAEATVEAADPANNQATLQNIRLWDWRALQDTLRQIQEIRTYYDFPDIDIDRYRIDGSLRQMMLATRELSIDKLPESSRNWINEKLIYTHGYGVTMNPVNGFTPEGLPTLILSNMPIQSTSPDVRVTRPEIYFGELTNTDVYVNTRQKEFNYPQGQANNLTSYEGRGGIVLGGLSRRLLIALSRGDAAKLPFSDDVTAESRLLMRRNLRDRVAALAPFLTIDSDPYMVVREDGRLSWLMDAFTVSDRYPYSRPYTLGSQPINYLRNSVKVAIDAYDGTTTFYVFDPQDPIVSAWRRIFPSLFRDDTEMPADLRAHVRYPELLLALQADVYGLYHMTNPEAFYNRDDLWTVATAAASDGQSGQTTQPMEPNFVLMRLPGESQAEFVEMLPFTPAKRNNMIGWIAGRSDAPHYGESLVYDFPKTRLVDGPLQVEARIDQNPQLSGQLSLWNQQGSRVRRGQLLVIPMGRALLYAESIYLQAERSPMPELRLVVLALQDKLAYGPTFEAALAGLMGEAASPATVPAPPGAPARPPTAPAPPAADLDALIVEASREMADYQRLTAEGRLGEAGQKLEQLKRTLDELSKRRR
jgi:uncharacterized protein